MLSIWLIIIWIGEDEDLDHVTDACIWDYLMVFIYTPSEEWEFIGDLDYNDYSGYSWFDSDNQTEDMPTYKLQKLMPDYEKLFRMNDQHKLQPEDYTDALLKSMMKILFPQETFHVETRNGTPFIWDDSGKEYFLGGVMEFVEGRACEKIYWNFPDEKDDPWVPFA